MAKIIRLVLAAWLAGLSLPAMAQSTLPMPALPAGSDDIRTPFRNEAGKIVPKRRGVRAAPPLAPRTCGPTSDMPGEARIEHLSDLVRPPGPATFGVFFRQGMVRAVLAALCGPAPQTPV